MVSVVLKLYADTSPGVLIGTLRNKNGVAQYYSAVDTWTSLNNIITSVAIYNLIREDRGDTYLTQDFFPTVMTNSLYNKLLDEKLKSSWFKRVNSIAPKIRTINTNVELGSYDKAQHMVNSLQTSLLSLLV
jgi:hypothetical protein